MTVTQISEKLDINRNSAVPGVSKEFLNIVDDSPKVIDTNEGISSPVVSLHTLPHNPCPGAPVDR
ncbi:MAG: hypothetical protein ABH879_05790 [archaeon]